MVCSMKKMQGNLIIFLKIHWRSFSEVFNEQDNWISPVYLLFNFF